MASGFRFVTMVAIATFLLFPAMSRADVRTAVIESIEEPGLGIDVKTATVTVDDEVGVARFSFALWRAAAVPTGKYDESDPGLSLEVTHDEDVCEGAVTAAGDGKGDLPYLNVVTRSSYDSVTRQTTYGYELNYRINFRPDILTAPVALSPDRMSLSFEISDPLLVGTDLRCVGGYARGRTQRDVTRADGGPTTEEAWSGWFAGYRPPFRLRYRATNPQRFKTGSNEFVEHSTRCTFTCSVRVRGYAATIKGTRIPGLNLHHDYESEAEAEYDTIYEFSSGELRRLRRALSRHGRIRYVLSFRAEDAFGRVQKLNRRITLLPPGTRGGGGGRPSTRGGDRDCSDFSSQTSAQNYFDRNGGSASNNVDGLDADHDGVACESLP